MKKTIIFIIIIVLVLGAGIWMMVSNRSSEDIIGGVGDGICPQDAKVCPDGSSVGRVGPSCEFEACPDIGSGQPDRFFESRSLGVRLEYPSGWTVSGQTDNETGSKEVNVKSKDSFLNITIFENKDKVFLKPWFESSFDKEDNADCEFSDPSMKIGKYYAKLVRIRSGAENGICYETGIYANADDNSKVVKVEFDEKGDSEVLAKILGTFEFIK